MSKIKFYAIKGPEGNKIVNTWEECEKRTHGVKGVLYKSFSSQGAAEAWLMDEPAAESGGLRIYVDGSYSPDCEFSGWAFVAVKNGVELACSSGVTELPAESRNIDGELKASLEALRWLSQMGEPGTICHDYEGIGRWALGQWQARSNVAKNYVRLVLPLIKQCKGVVFEKVTAHAGVKWNEVADKMAKEAIRTHACLSSEDCLPLQ
ncbi:MAG: viroplasmin family protein [Fibrobacteraceae bacterium]|nr:viroplasmin family protein [Fibrobacteraceae bacterium]